MKSNNISIRLTDSEKEQLGKEAENAKLSLSNYIRYRLFDSSEVPYRPNPDVIPTLGSISTEINKYCDDQNIEHFYAIKRGVTKLWQILL